MPDAVTGATGDNGDEGNVLRSRRVEGSDNPLGLVEIPNPMSVSVSVSMMSCLLRFVTGEATDRGDKIGDADEATETCWVVAAAVAVVFKAEAAAKSELNEFLPKGAPGSGDSESDESSVGKAGEKGSDWKS